MWGWRWLFAKVELAYADASCPTIYVSPGTYPTTLIAETGDRTIRGIGSTPAILDGENAHRVR